MQYDLCRLCYDSEWRAARRPLQPVIPRLIVPILAVLALLSCSPPPFNLAVSQEAAIASKMTFVGQVGPVKNLPASQSDSNFAFLPEKDSSGGISLQAGFVTWVSQSGPQNYAAVSGQSVYGSVQSATAVSPDQYPAFLFQAVKSFHNLEVFQYDDATPDNNSYTLLTGNPSTSTFPVGAPVPTLLKSLVTGPPSPFNLNGKRVIGVSFYPDQNPAKDRTYWLFRETFTNQYLEAELDNSQAGMNAATAVPLRGLVTYDLSVNNVPTGFLPNHMLRVLYYYDPLSGRSYACWWDTTISPNRWRTWVWTDTIPTSTELTSVSNRIDAVLTTGELFSTDGAVGRVYDENGNQLSQFSLTSFSFVGEEYVGGTAQVIFSQALWYNNSLQFNVYSIPTSNLKSLGQ